MIAGIRSSLEKTNMRVQQTGEAASHISNGWHAASIVHDAQFSQCSKVTRSPATPLRYGMVTLAYKVNEH